MSALDSRVRADLRRLVKTRQTVQPLPAVAAPSPLPSTRAIGQEAATAATGTGGIASPWTETARTAHASPITSSDGYLVLATTASITFADANGATVNLILAAPTP